MQFADVDVKPIQMQTKTLYCEPKKKTPKKYLCVRIEIDLDFACFVGLSILVIKLPRL